MRKIRGRRGILEVDATDAVDAVFSQTVLIVPEHIKSCFKYVSILSYYNPVWQTIPCVTTRLVKQYLRKSYLNRTFCSLLSLPLVLNLPDEASPHHNSIENDYCGGKLRFVVSRLRLVRSVGLGLGFVMFLGLGLM